jgi:hypothetical protein
MADLPAKDLLNVPPCDNMVKFRIEREVAGAIAISSREADSRPTAIAKRSCSLKATSFRVPRLCGFEAQLASRCETSDCINLDSTVRTRDDFDESKKLESEAVVLRYSWS